MNKWDVFLPNSSVKRIEADSWRVEAGDKLLEFYEENTCIACFSEWTCFTKCKPEQVPMINPEARK